MAPVEKRIVIEPGTDLAQAVYAIESYGDVDGYPESFWPDVQVIETDDAVIVEPKIAVCELA